MTTTMKFTLDAFALKPFTKALTCLSKYGDELSIYGTPDNLFLSATNSSKSAYCRFKYERAFFSKYILCATRLAAGSSSGGGGSSSSSNDVDETPNVTGQLLTKSLLSVLKHRAIEKTVERCDVSIIEGHEDGGGVLDEASAEETRDDLETRLIMRFHCKHGVVKTHRLILMTPTTLMAPDIPDVSNESNLTIGPRALKDMIEHFPPSRGSKSDPQLIWSFGEMDVEVRSLESSIDTKGKAQLATELHISAEEFDVYDIYTPPTTIAFHLREFNATIAYADAMSLSIDLHFTDPAAPLYIEVEGDNFQTLFVISTSQVYGAIAGRASANQQRGESKKREREETAQPPGTTTTRYKKPMKVVAQVADPKLSAVPRSPVRGSMRMSPRATAAFKEPLFLPSSSQLSAKDEAMLRETGLGIENMDANELANMWEGEGEEVGQSSLQEGTEIPPTQSVSDNKNFQALFED